MGSKFTEMNHTYTYKAALYTRQKLAFTYTNSGNNSFQPNVLLTPTAATPAETSGHQRSNLLAASFNIELVIHRGARQSKCGQQF